MLLSKSSINIWDKVYSLPHVKIYPVYIQLMHGPIGIVTSNGMYAWVDRIIEAKIAER